MTRKRTKTSAPSATGDTPRKGKGGQPPLLDEQIARIWVLAAEGLSLRETASEVGCDPSTVHAHLMRDPDRLEDLIAQQRRARADQWKKIEDRGQSMLLDMMTRAGGILGIGPQVSGETKKTRKVPSREDDYFIQHGRPWAAVIRLAAEGAANKHQLLTGQPTDRTESATTSVVVEQTPEECIRLCYSEGRPESVPAGLRYLEKKMLREGKIQPRGEKP